MASSVSTGDGSRNVVGKYLVAEPLDYFHFAEAPDWVYGSVLQPDPETRPAASKARMGATHFLTKTLPKVAAEMALSVLAYNLTRVMNIVGTKPLMVAIVA